MIAEDTRVKYIVTITRDGNQWEALYGSDPMSGSVGYGDTPSDALRKVADELEVNKPSSKSEQV